jgi:hypothetical protein
MFNYKPVNWYDECLDSFYGDDNNGYVFGVYAYDDDDEDFPIDVSWFKCKKTRDLALMEAIKE